MEVRLSKVMGDDMERPDRDRITKMEVEIVHLSNQVNRMAKQVAEMHDLLQQARGAKYFIIAAAAVGGFLSSKLAVWSGIIGGLPR